MHVATILKGPRDERIENSNEHHASESQDRMRAGASDLQTWCHRYRDTDSNRIEVFLKARVPALRTCSCPASILGPSGREQMPMGTPEARFRGESPRGDIITAVNIFFRFFTYIYSERQVIRGFVDGTPLCLLCYFLVFLGSSEVGTWELSSECGMIGDGLTRWWCVSTWSIHTHRPGCNCEVVASAVAL